MSQVVYLSNLVKWKGSKQVMRGEPVAAIGRIQERDNKGKLNRCQRRDNITQYPPSYSCILMQATSFASPHLKLCVLLWLGSTTCFILSLFYTEFSFLQLLILPFTFSGWVIPPKKKKRKLLNSTMPAA